MFEVKLPASSPRFGASVRASLAGPEDAL